MVAKDDKVCTYEQVPYNDLKRNKNCILVDVEHGGHCDFFTKNPASADFFGYKRVSISLDVKKSLALQRDCF